GLMVNAVPHWPGADDADQKLAMMANHVWSEFLAANRSHFSYREFARRTWRDGECFLRLFAESPEGPTVRFLDPETIGDTTEHPGTQGILTADHDVEHRLAYLRIDPSSGELLERIPASEVLHTRINADSNQKRGLTWFAPVLETLGQFERWMETTLIARKLQASIVLWRKVTGGTDSSVVADVGERGTIYDSGSAIPREKYRAGTILTTSEGTDLQYLHPTTNYRDGVPLGRLMLLCAAAGSGLPEYMLTSDASNANYASTLVAEGPAVKLFHSEQLFFGGEWNQLWRWVLLQNIASGQLPDNTFERIKPEWTFPNLAARDRPRERQADVQLANAGILSKAEVARRDNTDPQLMQAEIAREHLKAEMHDE
ncbi:MAG: phage portal protein, partial [Planctomycetaceae bacterium]|nr:phage portal protein [Planctomycetaceae bacterium]